MRLLRPPVGACAGMPVATFYPEVGEVDGYAAAEAVCAQCPVIAACLEYITTLEDRGAIAAVHGFAGGLRHTERRATRTAKAGR